MWKNCKYFYHNNSIDAEKDVSDISHHYVKRSSTQNVIYFQTITKIKRKVSILINPGVYFKLKIIHKS